MKTRVLLIDDEKFFTAAVKSNLENSGDYEVHLVNDSTVSVAEIRKLRPDIVLLDIIMPDLEGGDILDELEADPDLKDIPVLVVTAMIGHGDSDENGIVKFGDHVLLAKPIETSTLIKCIEDKLAGRI